MPKYLITGGAGFIGSHLADLLTKEGDEVIVLDDLSTGSLDNLPQNKSVTFTKGTILDKNILEKAFHNLDGVFHLAAVASVQKSISNWHYCHEVNSTGTINIFLEALKSNIPVVYTSSAAIYGDSANLPLTENSDAKPMSPYAIDKYTSELQAKAFGKLKNLKTFGLRLFNVYGSRQNTDSDYSGVISIFRNAAQNDKEIVIFGDGEQTRDFIHVSDVVIALKKAMPAASAEAPIVNLCTGKASSINHLASIISAGNIKHMDAQVGSIKDSLGSPKLAEEILGFKAKVSLEEGIKDYCRIDVISEKTS